MGVAVEPPHDSPWEQLLQLGYDSFGTDTLKYEISRAAIFADGRCAR